MTPRTSEINDKTQIRLNITQGWRSAIGIITVTVTVVVGYYSLIRKIEETAEQNIKPIRQNMQLIQTEVNYQGQYIWSLPENDKLRSLKNDAIQQLFREFAAEDNNSMVYRDVETGLFKFKQ